jgi:hypothetical protein
LSVLPQKLVPHVLAIAARRLYKLKHTGEAHLKDVPDLMKYLDLDERMQL